MHWRRIECPLIRGQCGEWLTPFQLSAMYHHISQLISCHKLFSFLSRCSFERLVWEVVLLRGRAPLTQFPFAFLTRTRTSEAHPNFESSYSIKPKDLHIFPSHFWKGRRESNLTSPTSKVLVGGATTTGAPLDHCSLEKMHPATDEGGKSELEARPEL